MNKLMKSCYSGLASGFLLSFLGASSVHAAPDVLDTPAAKTSIGHENLLLDVTTAGDSFVAVGARGHILVSNDQGESWQQKNTPVSVLLTAVDFVDDNKGWAVGHSGIILATDDGGETWTKQFDGIVANDSIIEQAKAEVARLELELETASEDEYGDVEYELEDATFALEDAEFDAQVGASKPFLDVEFWNSNEGIAVGAYNFIFKTIDGGKSWQNYGNRLDNLDRFHLNSITEIPGGTLILAGEAGLLFRSTDKGESWELSDSPYDGSFFGVVEMGDEDSALVFGLRGNMFKTTDAGITWDRVESGTENSLMGGSFDGNSKISIVGNSGSVLYSKDKGETFEEYVRENRLGNVSLVFLSGRRMVMVGESGVSLTTPDGQNL